VRSLLGHTAAMILLAGCGSVTGVCEPIAPRELPDGSGPGVARVETADDGSTLWRWGSGDGQVAQAARRIGASGVASCAPGEMQALDGCQPLGDATATVRGHPAFVVAVGNEVESQVRIDWLEAGCAYQTWVGPGLTVEQALDYAARY
jgi:hypothetical protein